MKVKEALKSAALKLKNAGIEDAGFEAKCLIEHFTGLTQIQIMLGDSLVNDEKAVLINSAVEKRIEGYPLQYILGQWEFMDYTFSVGEGVLIPRPETELLVELAIKRIERVNNPIVFDLCSGSGCIGISIAKARPDARVFLFEKYEAAFCYLIKNVKNLNVQNAVPIKCDITKDISELCLPIPYVIVSNPPYIRSDEMESLQEEVKKEPSTALDGGEDGMDFYRVIAEIWIPLIKNKGAFFMECEPPQTIPLAKMFSPMCTNVQIVKDLNKDPRIVCGDIH